MAKERALRRTPGARLNQPWRGTVGLVELGLAAFSAAVALWCWNRASQPYNISVPGANQGRAVDTLSGPWLALAALATLLALLLLVDAIRQLVLALRARRRRVRAQPSGWYDRPEERAASAVDPAGHDQGSEQQAESEQAQSEQAESEQAESEQGESQTTGAHGDPPRAGEPDRS